jgi:hypothetical protein
MLDYASMAGIALAILWGGTLCGIGCLAVFSIWSAGENRGAGLAGFFFTFVFVAFLFLTLSVANVFNVTDLMWPGESAM